MFGLGAFRNCDCFPVNDPVRKGTAELPGQGPSLARPRGPKHRETPVAQAGVLGAACAGSPTGTGRLRELNRACRTVCQTLCSSARKQQRARPCTWAGSKPCPMRCWPHTALPGPRVLGHVPPASRCERCWVRQPGGAQHGAFPACKSRSEIVLTWQQQMEVAQNGIWPLCWPPSPAKGQLALPLCGALGFTARPRG